MKKSSKRKTLWRINVVVSYFDVSCVKPYRGILIKLLKDLASIYKLDYSVADDYQDLVSEEEESSEEKFIYDIIYFRSNKYTRIEKKEFQSVINCMFKSVPSVFFEGVEIDTQLYKFLKFYPFPTNFYRPLNYPWIEYYDGEQTKLLIHADEVLKIMEEEQHYPLN